MGVEIFQSRYTCIFVRSRFIPLFYNNSMIIDLGLSRGPTVRYTSVKLGYIIITGRMHPAARGLPIPGLIEETN